MRFFGNRIICKSLPSNWDKEKSGRKDNTVREMGEKEWREFETFRLGNADYPRGEAINRRAKISIENTKSGESFDRYITDITLFKKWEDESGELSITKYIVVISFSENHPHDVCCNGAPAEEAIKSDEDFYENNRYLFGLDLGDKDDSVIVIAKQHKNGSIEILNTNKLKHV